MNWLHEAVTDGRSQRVSSKRVVLLWGAFIIGICTLILAIAEAFGDSDLALAFGTAATLLVTGGTGGYLGAKHIEGQRSSTTGDST